MITNTKNNTSITTDILNYAFYDFKKASLSKKITKIILSTILTIPGLGLLVLLPCLSLDATKFILDKGRSNRQNKINKIFTKVHGDVSQEKKGKGLEINSHLSGAIKEIQSAAISNKMKAIHSLQLKNYSPEDISLINEENKQSLQEIFQQVIDYANEAQIPLSLEDLKIINKLQQYLGITFSGVMICTQQQLQYTDQRTLKKIQDDPGVGIKQFRSDLMERNQENIRLKDRKAVFNSTDKMIGFEYTTSLSAESSPTLNREDFYSAAKNIVNSQKKQKENVDKSSFKEWLDTCKVPEENQSAWVDLISYVFSQYGTAWLAVDLATHLGEKKGTFLQIASNEVQNTMGKLDCRVKVLEEDKSCSPMQIQVEFETNESVLLMEPLHRPNVATETDCLHSQKIAKGTKGTVVFRFEEKEKKWKAEFGAFQYKLEDTLLKERFPMHSIPEDAVS